MSKGRITRRSVDALRCLAGKDPRLSLGEVASRLRRLRLPSRNAGETKGQRQEGRCGAVPKGRPLAPRRHRKAWPADARRAKDGSEEALGSRREGSDPIAERRAAREVRTFKTVAEEWLRLHVAAKRKCRTGDAYQRALRLHILPALGSKRIVDVRRADVARLHAKFDGEPYAANKAVAVVSAIWNWAARREEVAFADNPAKGVDRFPEHKRQRFLKTEELARLGDALREGETIGLSYSIDETKPKAKHAPRAENRRAKLDPSPSRQSAS